MARADAVNTEEDTRFGENNTPEDIPSELHRREKRLAKIQEAKAALEREAIHTRIETLEEQARGNEDTARTHSDAAQRKRSHTLANKRREEAGHLRDKLPPDDENGPGTTGQTPDGLQKHRVEATPEGKPASKAQRNFTDPDSRIMESGGNYMQAYNGQLAVDDGAQIIVAQSLTNQAPDNEHLVPMLDQIIEHCGEGPKTLTADAGYWAPTHEKDAKTRGVDALIAQRRKRHHEPSGAEADRNSQDDARQSMSKKLSSADGKAIYACRKAVVEPVNGQIKEARGYRRFHLRGLEGAAGEWSLLATCHNLLKLFHYGELYPASV